MVRPVGNLGEGGDNLRQGMGSERYLYGEDLGASHTELTQVNPVI